MPRLSGHTRMYLILAGICIVIFVSVLSAYLPSRTLLPPPENPRYLDPELSTAERVEDLLSHMTLEEKIGQMALVEKNSVRTEGDLARYGIGALLSGAGGKPEENSVAGWSDMVVRFTEASRSSRLKIPILYGVDANHGHSNVPGATIFPHFIGLGAAGDVALVEAVASATRAELIGTGISWSFSPTLDLPEDIRWGRTYEAFSDDPTLAGTLGAAYVRGLQGSGAHIAVLATPKHYIGAGAMRLNTSSNENFSIDQGTTPPDETKLRAVYLPPFRAAVDAGALSVMAGLNSWGTAKLSTSSYLLTDVLKGELGFEGFIVSDWYGVYEIPGGEYRAAVTAINAGIDMVMLPFDYRPFVRNVRRAVTRGEITESRIDDAVRRILRAKFALGLFERAAPLQEEGTVGSLEHRTLARRAVSESLVLLKDDGVLPLSASAQHVRVAGSAAHNIGRQAGAWTVEWQGIDGNWLPGATSILDGLREVLGDDVQIEFSETGTFPADTQAEVGIAVVGEPPYAEGWGDNNRPELSAADLEAIERLHAVSERVVVVLVTGRPLFITDQLENWDALVVAWLPGSEGAGVADVLTGARPFTGKLPLPWPSEVSQLPIENGVTRDGTAVLFPRGYGLR